MLCPDDENISGCDLVVWFCQAALYSLLSYYTFDRTKDFVTYPNHGPGVNSYTFEFWLTHSKELRITGSFIRWIVTPFECPSQ